MFAMFVLQTEVIPHIMYLVEERCALCHLLDYKTSDTIPQIHTEGAKRREDHRDYLQPPRTM